MTSRKLGATLAALLALALAGCEVPSPEQKLPQLSYSHLAPYRLNVGRVEIASEYQSPMRDPHVEHVMPVSPEAAIKRWAQDRLRPVGTTGAVRVVIRDARVVEVPLQVDRGIGGLFKSEQAQRYDANVELVLQALDERNMPKNEIVARTQRSRTVTEGITLNQRDRIWFDLVDDMMKDLSAQLDSLIPQYFNEYIVR